MIVMKFGGTSVSDSHKIRDVVDIIKSRLSRSPVAVVSAMGGVTDGLLRIADASADGKDAQLVGRILDRHYVAIDELGLSRDIIRREADELAVVAAAFCGRDSATQKQLDELMSFGERMSARIVSACLSSHGIASNPYDAYDIGMITDSCFGNADILTDTPGAVRKILSQKEGIPVITGFIGKDREGNITTFGRGGSDYTASIIGAAMGAEEIQIWTDVDGVMTADPRIVSTAMSISALSYEEESELEALGAANLNPKGIRPAMESGIPVRILNTFNPGHKGTVISKDAVANNRIASITYRKDVSVMRIEAEGTRPEVFGRMVEETLGRHGVPIKSMSVSGCTAFVVVDKGHDTSAATEELGRTGDISVMGGMAQISLVGNGIADVPGVEETLSSSLRGVGVELIATGQSETNRSIAIREEHMVKAVRLLHSAFFGR